MNDLNAVDSHNPNQESLKGTIDRLKKAGIDPAHPRQIEFSFFASSGESAKKLAQALQARGFILDPEPMRGEDALAWWIHCSYNLSVVDVVDDLFVADAIQFANEFGGGYDGWSIVVN